MTREQAYLAVVEGWLRDNRRIVFTEGAVDDLCDRIAAEVERLTADNAKLIAVLELIAGAAKDKLQAMQARSAVTNIGANLARASEPKQ
jgi:hypothetical protein